MSHVVWTLLYLKDNMTVVFDMRTEPTQENPLLKKKGIRRAGANNQVKTIPNLTFRFEKTFNGF